MQDLTNLRIRSTKYPWIKGTIISQLDEDCPERPGFPRYVSVTWDMGDTVYYIPLKHLESAS